MSTIEIFLQKSIFVFNEGAIFALVAMGVYVAFEWVRFPDLSPDGSFLIGATVFALTAPVASPFVAIVLATLCSAGVGLSTGAINRFCGVPSVVAGLLVSSACYSVSWLLLTRPNVFLAAVHTVAGEGPVFSRSLRSAACLLLTCGVVVWGLAFFSKTIWGMRLRALGENPLLARDLRLSESNYTVMGLTISNGIVGLGAAWFAQRSFAADVSMGAGMTVSGLSGMILGLLLTRRTRKAHVILFAVCIGALAYKLVTFISIEVGLPPESFRLVSAGLLLGAFLLFRNETTQILRGLKWS